MSYMYFAFFYYALPLLLIHRRPHVHNILKLKNPMVTGKHTICTNKAQFSMQSSRCVKNDTIMQNNKN